MPKIKNVKRPNATKEIPNSVNGLTAEKVVIEGVVQEDEKAKTEMYKCEGCKEIWDDKTCVINHVIRGK